MSGPTFSPHRAALLSLDFLPTIVENYATDGEAAARCAGRVMAAAREADVPVIHVVPERDDSVHPAVAPAGGEEVLRKATIGAFATTKLELTLRRAERDTLIIVGIATSGTVLSTVRWAYDLGYVLYVVEDGCSDPDAATHRALTADVESQSWIGLWRLGTVLTADAMITQLRARTE